jgi:hypothetical protein
MRLGFVFSVTMLVSGVAQAGTPAREGFRQLDAELVQRCPAKHLELLSPASLNGAIETFRDDLPRAAHARLERANDEKRACAETVAGVSCENHAYLRAMVLTGMMDTFAGLVCRMPVTCRASSVCND